MKFLFFILLFLSLLFFSCSENNGISEQDLNKALKTEAAKRDSLIQAMRDDIAQGIWDSIHDQKSLDSLYNALFDSEFTLSWFDSSRAALKDSLLENSYDSLYDALYDSVYTDIYSRSLNRLSHASIYFVKPDFNTAFSNQYSLMYKDWTYPIPVAVNITNSDYTYHNYMVKAWIPEWSDTGTVSDFVNSSESKIIGPAIMIAPEKLRFITVAQQVNLRVQSFMLENNREILLADESRPITLHPPQVNGVEYVGVENRSSWYAVWVTPNMDSITNLHTQMLDYMGSFGGYQKFGESTVEAGVRKQVKTIYELLGAKKISYVSNSNAGSLGQKIKYPSEVLQTKQANCIEGVTLFASLLESIGIRAVVVLVPGHAFLGWYNTENGDDLEFLETTYAWNSPLPSFSQAATYGKQEYDDALNNNEIYDIVDIRQARISGIMPGHL